MAVGVKVGFKDQARVAVQVQKRVEEGRQVGLNAERYRRKDAAGNRQADSGRAIWEGGLTLGSLQRLPADLEAAGYRLERCYLQQKQGDSMFALRLWFGTAGEPAVLSAEAESEVGKLLGSAWEHVHGYLNPDGTATVNPSHRVDGPPKGRVKFVRFTAEGFGYSLEV
jgi:hypothetical protein